MDYIKLIGGLLLLVISGDYLVRGGVAIATKLRVSSLVIGMTVVAFGTSAPELLVSLQAALKGSSEIAVGNVVGSNIANIALILGLTALVYPLKVSYNTIRYDWPIMMLATLLFMWVASSGEIGRLAGIIGFLGLVGYTIWQIYTSRKVLVVEENGNEVKPSPVWLAIIYIIVSCAGLAYGADFLIQGASNIAHSFGVSERIIGVTIVAFGTSLPELAASLSAAFKKETDIAMGNIVGSNLFNILSVIGLTAAIQPIEINWPIFRSDFIWMSAITFLLVVFIIPLSKIKQIRNQKSTSFLRALFMNAQLGRGAGIVFVVIYIFYIYTLLINR